RLVDRLAIENTEHETVGDVTKLPYVSRPRIGQQDRQRLLIQYRRVALEPSGGIQREVLEQQWNIFAPLAKWRQFDECDSESIVEIGAKQLLLAQLQQIC